MSSKVLIKMYNDLDIRCGFENCKKIVKLLDLAKHESVCQRPKCWNHEICEGNDEGIKAENLPCCSSSCALLKALLGVIPDQKKMYEEIKKFLNGHNADAKKESSLVSTSTAGSSLLKSTPSVGNISFRWDPTKAGQGIEITEGGQAVFLREQSYVFRTVIAEAVPTHVI